MPSANCTAQTYTTIVPESTIGERQRKRYNFQQNRRERAEKWEEENVRTLRRPSGAGPSAGTQKSPFQQGYTSSVFIQDESPIHTTRAPQATGRPADLDPYTYACLWWALGGWTYARHTEYFLYWAAATLFVAMVTRKNPEYLLYSFFFTAGCYLALHHFKLL